MTVFDSLTGTHTDYRHNEVRHHAGRELSLAQLISENAYRMVRAVERRIARR